MLYITRSRYKESVTAADLPKYNKAIATEILPAIQQVEGVRSAQGYTSIAGELVFVLEIQDMATVDRILTNPGTKAAMAKIYDATVRTGGEVMYDLAQWQGLYGGAPGPAAENLVAFTGN